MMAFAQTLGLALHHPMKGEGCIHDKTDHSKQDFHRSDRWKCLVRVFLV